MPIFENISKCSFIFHVKFFFEKIIFLKFWYLFLELFYAKFVLQLLSSE
jgi:hypothetical protein